MRRHPKASFARVPIALLGTLVLGLIVFLGVTSASADTTPSVSIAAPSPVTYTSAQLKGTVNPNGGPSTTNWHFEYSPSGEEGTFEWVGGGGELSGPDAEGTNPVPVEETLSGLEAGRTYYLRLVATNEEEANRAVVSRSFTTESISQPAVSIDAPSAVTGTSAHFSGLINPEGTDPAFAVNWRFECSPACPGLEGSLPADTSSHAVEADATGLQPGTDYDVSLVAKNAGEAATAGPESFTTDTVAPAVSAARASATTSEAEITAQVNPGGLATTYYVQYGPTGSYGSTSASKTIAAKGTPQSVVVNLAGLAESATYYAKLIATNAQGADESAKLVFTTQRPQAPRPGNCPNENIRIQQGSTYLPDCRAYELVSPADKAGGSVSSAPFSGAGQNSVSAVAEDGAAAAFWSYQAFGGAQSSTLNPYKAVRTDDGWRTVSVVPALPSRPNYSLNGIRVSGVTPDLSSFFIKTGQAFDPLDQRPEGLAGSAFDIYKAAPGTYPVWISRPDGEVPATTALSTSLSDYVGASADGGDVFFHSLEALTLPAEGKTEGSRILYERIDNETRMVGLDENGNPLSTCGSVLGRGDTASTLQGAVSDDGSHVYFSSPDPTVFSEEPDCLKPTQLYLRRDGQLVEVSRSQRTVPDPEALPARFEGASSDGSVVVFGSDEALTDDADLSADKLLYAYAPASEDLSLISPPQGNVLGVSGLSKDGSHVYYLQDEPGPGAELKVFTFSDGKTRLVTHLDGLETGSGGGNELEPLIWGEFQISTRVTPDGRSFLFQANTSVTAYDSKGTAQLYLYNSELEDTVCVSCHPGGMPPRGDAGLRASGIDSVRQSTFPLSQNISSDGRRVMFHTSDSLVPRDHNGAPDVYQWHNGEVSLISDGKNRNGSYFFGASVDGRTVLFSTASGILPQDFDREDIDIYAARVDGGLAFAGVPQRCVGEICQGQISALAVGGTVASGRLAGSASTKPRAHRRSKARKKHRHRRQNKSRQAHSKTRKAGK